jgi:hypothetical protein
VPAATPGTADVDPSRLLAQPSAFVSARLKSDLAFAEVRQRLALLLPEAELTAIPVPPFDTVSAGFVLARPVAFGDGPPDRVLYANVAPRQDEDRPREDSAGERLHGCRRGVLLSRRGCRSEYGVPGRRRGTAARRERRAARAGPPATTTAPGSATRSSLAAATLQSCSVHPWPASR